MTNPIAYQIIAYHVDHHLYTFYELYSGRRGKHVHNVHVHILTRTVCYTVCTQKKQWAAIEAEKQNEARWVSDYDWSLSQCSYYILYTQQGISIRSGPMGAL
jgi:hypothetical protein